MYVSVCAVADDSRTSDETGPATEGVCSIGIVMCVLFVNVFTAAEELWEGFERRKGYPWVAFHGCFMQLSSARRAWEGSLHYDNHVEKLFTFIIYPKGVPTKEFK